MTQTMARGYCDKSTSLPTPLRSPASPRWIIGTLSRPSSPFRPDSPYPPMRRCRSPSPTSQPLPDEAYFTSGAPNPSRHNRRGAFYGASNFILNNPIIQEINQFVNGNYLNLTLERLAKHTMPGAAFDSSAEESPPRCHSGTRRFIINDVLRWFGTSPRDRGMLWLSGPAGVGKTAIMRSIADIESRSKRLGATVFFSRANKRDDPTQFVHTLVYQLAVGIPSYQEFLKDQMIADPQLLHKGSEELFRRLIIEPFGYQMLYNGMDPWLILIDGLDECDGGEQTQRGIVEMISDFVQQFPESPLVWVVASRPEPWLQAAFLCAEPSCRREYIDIDAKEAQKDVERYLRDEFAAICRDRPDLIPSKQQWPSEAQICGVSRAASGLFVFASTVVRFVRDPNVANPVGQLLIVLAAIENFGLSFRSENPLSILHNLYLQVLNSMPRPIYAQVTKRILGCCDLLPRNTFHPTTFMLSCNFLGIEQHDAYAALQKLHSVLDIPSQDEAATREIRVLHTSFTDFLRNRKGSREYHVGRTESGADIVRSSFRVLQEANRGSSPFPRASKIALSWEHQPEKTRQALLATAYDGFRLLTAMERQFNCSFALKDRIALLAQADFSKLDCYLHPDVKTSVHDTRTHHKSLFDWLVEQWQANPEALRHAVPVTEFPLKDLKSRSIRKDRAAIHFRFTSGRSGNVVRPKVYSGHKEIREKYKGDNLKALEGVLRRLPSAMQVQMWGSDPAKTCLLFTCEPGATPPISGEQQVVKEIFFIPYEPPKNQPTKKTT